LWARTATTTAVLLDALHYIHQRLRTWQNTAASFVIDVCIIEHITDVIIRDGRQNDIILGLTFRASLECVPPLLIAGLCCGRRWSGRVDDDVETIGFENTVWRATCAIAAALVVQHGDLFARTLPVSDTNLNGMRRRIVLISERFDRRMLRHVDVFALRHEDIVSTAVDSRSRFDAHVSRATRCRFVLRDFETTDHAPSMQALLMIPELVNVVPLFVAEVALDQQFPREIMISGKWIDVTRRAAGGTCCRM
jgi:hypothetical protein